MNSRLLSTVGWRQMPLRDLIQFCSTNKEMNTICQDPATWQYLLERDFQVKTRFQDPRKEYVKIVLEKAAEKSYQIGYRNELLAEDRNSGATYEDSSTFYRMALSALGKDISFTNLFGNKVGKYFADYLDDDAHDYNVNILTALIDYVNR